MADGNFPALRYAFVAIFIPACLYKLQLGLQVAGVYIAGLSLYGWFLGKIPLVNRNWKTTRYLTGAAATVVSAVGVFISVIFFFAPGWVISAVGAIRP